MSASRYPWKNTLSQESCCDVVEKLKVKNLNLFYGSKQILHNLNLNINKNCVTGIIGPSGCGKSSFVQCLNRMIELTPSAKVNGDIFLDQQSIFDSRLELIELRKKIGIVFQEPTPLPLSIENNIALPLKEHQFSSIEERVKQSLVDVGLWPEVKDKVKKPAALLSGGQKQRLCLARALALQPEVILMDEPCSNLDPLSTEIIEELILELKSKYTIVIVTHNLAQARRICDHIYAFWNNKQYGYGEILESGSCADIFERPNSDTLADYVGGLRG